MTVYSEGNSLADNLREAYEVLSLGHSNKDVVKVAEDLIYCMKKDVLDPRIGEELSSLNRLSLIGKLCEFNRQAD